MSYIIHQYNYEKKKKKKPFRGSIREIKYLRKFRDIQYTATEVAPEGVGVLDCQPLVWGSLRLAPIIIYIQVDCSIQTIMQFVSLAH